MVESKLTRAEWHFHQVGHGGKKNHMGFFFYRNFRSKNRDFL
jgi:hypothetical protein